DLPVTVRNVAPVVDAGGDAEVRPGKAFHRTDSFTDPGTDTWTGTVDYGDGSGPQTLKLVGKDKFDLHHTYERAGTYRVVVTVQDEDGGIGPEVFSVTVAPGREGGKGHPCPGPADVPGPGLDDQAGGSQGDREVPFSVWTPLRPPPGSVGQWENRCDRHRLG